MSAPLPTGAEVVVIGGGAIGASIAFHLAEAGTRDVLLLERAELASGSTVKAAGGVRAQFSDPVNIALGARSLEAFERFSERPGQAIDLHQPGYLFVITRPGDLAEFESAVALQNELGVASRMLSATQAAALSPAVRMDDVLGAAFHARDGYCSPESVVLGYASGARRHGATIRTGVEVTRIELTGGAVSAVVTDAGTVATTAVICAAGAWSASVGAMAGVDLPVVPLRRQVLVTEPVPGHRLAEFPASMPMTIDAATSLYLHREGPGVLLGMSYRGEQPGFRLDYSEDWLPDLTAAIEHRCPALLDVGIAHRWAGLYEVTPDENALIGGSAETGFWYATGFSGHGFLQAPAVGEVIRDLVLGHDPVIDIRPLSVDRFAGGTPRPELAIV